MDESGATTHPNLLLTAVRLSEIVRDEDQLCENLTAYCVQVQLCEYKRYQDLAGGRPSAGLAAHGRGLRHLAAARALACKYATALRACLRGPSVSRVGAILASTRRRACFAPGVVRTAAALYAHTGNASNPSFRQPAMPASGRGKPARTRTASNSIISITLEQVQFSCTVVALSARTALR